MSDLFGNTGHNLLPHGGELYYYPHWLTAEEAAACFQALQTEIPWQQQQIKMFGKLLPEPRLTAWLGTPEAVYTYSGVARHPLPFTPLLLSLKQRAEHITGATFNSALCNYYRNGHDSMGWHRDNERTLGADPVIASLSFGAIRPFKVRHYATKQPIITLLPASGSLIVMAGTMQQHWEHSLPRRTSPFAARINITFRKVFG